MSYDSNPQQYAATLKDIWLKTRKGKEQFLLGILDCNDQFDKIDNNDLL